MLEPLIEKIYENGVNLVLIDRVKYIPISEASRLAGVSHSTMKRWVKEPHKLQISGISNIIEGGLNQHPISRDYYIRQETLEKLLDKLKPAPVAH